MTDQPDDAADALAAHLDAFNEEANLAIAMIARKAHPAVIGAFGRLEQVAQRSDRPAVLFLLGCRQWARMVAFSGLLAVEDAQLPGVDENPVALLTEAGAVAIQTMIQAEADDDETASAHAFMAVHGDDRTALVWYLLYAAGATVRAAENEGIDEESDAELEPRWSDLMVATTDVLRRCGCERFRLAPQAEEGQFLAEAWKGDVFLHAEGTMAEACDELVKLALHDTGCVACRRKIDARSGTVLAPGFVSKALPCIWRRDHDTWVRGCDGGTRGLPTISRQTNRADRRAARARRRR